MKCQGFTEETWKAVQLLIDFADANRNTPPGTIFHKARIHHCCINTITVGLDGQEFLMGNVISKALSWIVGLALHSSALHEQGRAKMNPSLVCTLIPCGSSWHTRSPARKLLKLKSCFNSIKMAPPSSLYHQRSSVTYLPSLSLATTRIRTSRWTSRVVHTQSRICDLPAVIFTRSTCNGTTGVCISATALFSHTATVLLRNYFTSSAGSVILDPRNEPHYADSHFTCTQVSYSSALPLTSACAF